MNKTWLVVCICPALVGASMAADIQAVLDSTDGSSALVVVDSQTNQKVRVASDGAVSVSNTVNRGSGPRQMLVISGPQDVEIGAGANGYGNAVALGEQANGAMLGVAIGQEANGSSDGVALGANTDGATEAVAVGSHANGNDSGVAIGFFALGYNTGVALGYQANGMGNGTAVGEYAEGNHYGAALGSSAAAGAAGVALGRLANGAQTNVAIGCQANARGGSFRTAIGPRVTNWVDDSTALRGTLYLDGGTGLLYRATFGSGPWTDLAGALATAHVKKTGDTMTGPLAVGIISNLVEVQFAGDEVVVGNGARASASGVAVGGTARAEEAGVAVGYGARSTNSGAAVGYKANGALEGVAVGAEANARNLGVALGRSALGGFLGVGLGAEANGARTNVAVGYFANAQGGSERIAIGHNVTNQVNNSARLRGTLYLDGGTAVFYRASFGSGTWTDLLAERISGAAASNSFVQKAGDTMTGPLTVTTNITVDYFANRGSGGRQMLTIDGGSDVEIGANANAYYFGVAIGENAGGMAAGVAVGSESYASNGGVAVGYSANAMSFGAAVGEGSIALNHGVAMGLTAWGYNQGIAIGESSKGWNTNIAIGLLANASEGRQRIAIGNQVNNTVDHSVRIRGNLYLDGCTGIMTRATFGSGGWSAKTFVIDHPLDPESKVLRHYCMEGPEVWNVYAGNAQLVNGEAVVELPDYYEALNKAGSEIYGLTPIGALTPVAVKTEVVANRFVIMGGQDVKVSWTIKVLRNDPACLEDLELRPVEQLKSELPRGQAAAENQVMDTQVAQ